MDRARSTVLFVSTALGGVALAAGAGLLTSPAVADPPRGGMTQHTHHVHTGSGGCVDIDSVMFNVDHRGLHRGANSSGPERGPWHGTCDSRVFPGGPKLVDVGLPVHH